MDAKTRDYSATWAISLVSGSQTSESPGGLVKITSGGDPPPGFLIQ